MTRVYSVIAGASIVIAGLTRNLLPKKTKRQAFLFECLALDIM
jgi:hypothetical protein